MFSVSTNSSAKSSPHTYILSPPLSPLPHTSTVPLPSIINKIYGCSEYLRPGLYVAFLPCPIHLNWVRQKCDSRFRRHICVEPWLLVEFNSVSSELILSGMSVSGNVLNVEYSIWLSLFSLCLDGRPTDPDFRVFKKNKKTRKAMQHYFKQLSVYLKHKQFFSLPIYSFYFMLRLQRILTLQRQIDSFCLCDRKTLKQSCFIHSCCLPSGSSNSRSLSLVSCRQRRIPGTQD